VKHHLQQEVAKLVPQIIEITSLDRIRDLVGFLDGVRRYGGKILRQIPRAPGARRAQCRHDLDQADDVAGRSHIGHAGRTRNAMGYAANVLPRLRALAQAVAGTETWRRIDLNAITRSRDRSSKMTDAARRRWTVEEFFAWQERQSERYEFRP